MGGACFYKQANVEEFNWDDIDEPKQAEEPAPTKVSSTPSKNSLSSFNFGREEAETKPSGLDDVVIWSGLLVRNESKAKVIWVLRESSGYGCPFLVVQPGKSDALQLRWDICYHIHAAPYVYGNDPDTNPMVWRQHFKGCFKHTKEAELRRIGQFSPCSRVALDTIASVYATGKTVVISQSGAGLRLDLEDPEPKAATSTVKN